MASQANTHWPHHEPPPPPTELASKEIDNVAPHKLAAFSLQLDVGADVQGPAGPPPQKSSMSAGPKKSTDHDRVVSVGVPTVGPYGVTMEDDGRGKAAVIRAWEKLPDGRFGAVQRHGGVRVGDVLVGVNETPTAELPFPQVMELLRDENALRKTLHFSSRAELDRRRSATGLGDAAGAQAAGGRPGRVRFTSRVRRARVNDDTASSFAEYEIVCALRLDATKVEHETVRKWALWRRFSDFEKLEAQLRKSLGWQLDGAVFPPKRSFTFDKLAPDFLEQRRGEVDAWWQRVVAVDRACDFHMHHGDAHLKAFVKAADYLAARPAAGDGDEPPRPGNAVASNQRRRSSATNAATASRRPASMRSSLSKRKVGAPPQAASAPAVAARPPAAAAAAPAATPAAAAPAKPAAAAASKPPPPPPKAGGRASLGGGLMAQINSLRVD